MSKALDLADAVNGDLVGIYSNNSDKVDGIDAVTTATANKLLALNDDSKLPASITGGADGTQLNLDNHTGNTSNPHSVTKEQVGLGNVTNDAQEKSANKDTANGYAGLDNNSKVVENPASATTASTASSIPISDDSGYINTWVKQGVDSGLDADTVDGMQPDTNNTNTTIVQRDNNGAFSAGIITASLSGNASSADKLSTSRNIKLDTDATGNVNFDGSQDVTVSVTLDANAVLDKLKTVDGTGSGLDADTIDGIDSISFSQKAEDETIGGSKAWSNATLSMTSLPTDNPVVDGQLWNNSGIITNSNSINDIVTKDDNYTIVNTDTVILGDATNANITITLPTPTKNKRFCIKKIDSSTNTVIVSHNDTEKIDGSDTLVLANQWDFTNLISNGTDWFIV